MWSRHCAFACTTHVLLFFSSLTFSLFLLHSHLSSSSVIVDKFVYGRGATKQERCQVGFRSPPPVADLYRHELKQAILEPRGFRDVWTSDATGDGRVASCVFMLELNFHSGSSIYSSQWFVCLASHTSRSNSSVAHPSSSPCSFSLILSVAAASRIGVDHFFRHHLHFSSVGVVHPRRVGVIISAVTQIRCCGNQRNPPPSAVKVLKEMLLRFTLAAKESDYFVVSKQLELEISLTLAAKESFQSLWEFHVDLNRNASFISIEEDLQFEDLMKIVSEDFKEEVIGLSYGMSLDIKSIVEGFPPISIANTRHLISFIGKR
ncbi:hypothetical protein F2Q70_00038662 [Brassica cretica]|uniref:Uncharacterized protein n=1 Tax=Brassica cretica TaxID=69181 RepID=A0A8S9K9Z2_BRACR|nr:hypothetical protein F2Q70_00038662 [Brassica cretica]